MRRPRLEQDRCHTRRPVPKADFSGEFISKTPEIARFGLASHVIVQGQAHKQVHRFPQMYTDLDLAGKLKK